MAPALKRAKTLNEIGEVQAKGLEDLTSDLRNTVNRREKSDVTILCKDGISVHGCGWLLSIRCNVFKRLLSRMPRSKCSKISLENFSSSAMLSVLEYLYTGTVEAHAPIDWKMGLEVITAAQFFVIPSLETIARGFARNQMVKQVKDLEQHVAMEMLSTALEFEDCLEEKDDLVMKLVCHLGDNWLQEGDHSWNLSEKAVDCLLSNRKTSRNGKQAHPLEEYCVFRWIVLWQLYQNVPENSPAVEVKPTILPIGTDIPSLWVSVFQPPMGSHDILPDNLASLPTSQDEPVVTHALAGLTQEPSLRRLLRHITWSLIPSFVLVKIVEPLHVVPVEDLLKVLSVHALRSPTKFPLPKWQWRHTSSLTPLSNGEILCISEERNKEGSAIAFCPMLRSHGVYEWQFRFREKDTDFLKFGFISGVDNHASLQNDLDKSVLLQKYATKTWYLSLGNQNQSCVIRPEPKPRFPDALEIMPPKLENLSYFTFTLDASQRTCRVFCASYNATWRDLPSAVYYPVVSFSRCKRARVGISFDKGFDYLSLS